MQTVTIRLALVALVYVSLLLGTSPLQAGECLSGLGGGSICGANDFQLVESLVSGPVNCTAGEIVSQPITVRVGIQPTANERYDIGFFVGDHGESPIGGASCTFVSLTPIESGGDFNGADGYGPYRDLDGNQCGDALKSDGIVYRESTLSDVLCQDTDGDGSLDIPYALTWQSQKGSCDDPLDPANFYPPTSSKCIAGVSNIDVPVLPPTAVPSISVSKTASPPLLLAPGGEVSYSLSVTNDGPVPVTLTSLSDDKFGDVNGSGDCSVPQTLAPGESYQCSFSVTLSGGANTPAHENTITVEGEDSDGNPTSGSDNAFVHFVDLSVNGSIGDLVWNDLNADGLRNAGEPGLDGISVDLFRKSGNIYSYLASAVTSDGGHYVFLSLPPGFYRVIPDIAAAPLNQMVHTGGMLPHDVTLKQNEHYIIADFGFARASMAVSKAVEPTEVFAPLATVDYTVTVVNDGPLPVTLIDLYDEPSGDLGGKGSCSLPQTLNPGDSYSCSFPETITGSAYDQHINTVTALAQDQDQNLVYGADSAWVYFVANNRAAIGHLVWNDLNADGVYDPGEPGFDNVTLHIDSGYDVSTRYGGQYVFHNLATPGAYEVTVTDSNKILQGYSLTTANLPYSVVFTEAIIDLNANFGYARAEIDVIKTADRDIVWASAKDVSYTVTVINTGSVVLMPTSLDDSVFGNLTASPYNCTLPSSLAPGAEYSCTFSVTLSGSGGDIHNNVVTVEANDGAGKTFTASDSENVRIIADIGGAIGNLVWLDANGDGVQDPDEPGIDGVSVDLLENGLVTESTVTERGGKYHFFVANGDYEVRVTDLGHILDGYILSWGSNPHGGIAISNSIDLGVDFGYILNPYPPSLTVEKATNGQDADLPPGPEISAGKSVTWSYEVTNSGPYFLTSVEVTDSRGVAVSCPQDTLDIGESMTCSASGSAVGGQYENIGTVTAEVPRYGIISASDPSHYYGKRFPFIPLPPCATFPLYCYVIADRDSSGAQVDRLFKYTFREDKLEYLNHLGVIDVETMTLSLDGKTIYATNGGVLGTIDPSPGITDSFSPINPAGVGSGNGGYGFVVFSDIDGLAINPTNGIMYATERYKEEEPDILDLLIQIDPATGTLVKNAFGPGKDYVIIDTRAAGVKDADDIDIDGTGQMYGVAGISGGGGGDQGLLIDKETGAVSVYASLHDANGGPVQDMEGFTIFNRNYYGTTGIEFAAQQTDNTLYKIDRQTGETEKIIRLDQEFEGFTPIDFEAITCFPVCRNK